jgi:type I restriction enzyme, S subunit
MGSKPLVPMLRFPEYREAPIWPALNGDHLFASIDRRPAAAGLPVLAITQEQGAVPRDQIDYHVSVTDTSIASYKEVRPGDFVISLRSFQGGIEYSRVHGICSPAYVILKRNGDGSDDFYRHLFKSPRFIQQITRNIEGIRDGKMISYKQFSEQLLLAPSPAEQRKIAECLTSLDELIAEEGRKLEALRIHKKGLMQNLFPREGETVPRIRFPEFRNAGEWAILNGDSLFHLIDRRPALRGLPLLAITKEHGAVARQDIEYHVSVTDASIATYKEVQPGDFIISLRSFQGGIEYSRVHGICSPAYLILRRKGIGIDDFYRHLFKSDRFIKQITRNIEGLRDGKMISYRQFSEQVLPSPSLAEQQLIADCLSSIDSIITADAKKLDTLKLHKQGLMQRLFPSTEG